MRSILASFRLFMIVLTSCEVLLSLFLVRVIFGNGAYGVKVRGFVWQWHMKFLCRVCGLNVHLESSFPLVEMGNSRFILVANHINYFDVIILGALARMGFLAKYELRNWPLFGQLSVLMGTLFVKRDCVWNRTGTLRSLTAGLGQRSYCIFPEGTTTFDSYPDRNIWMDGSFHAAKATRSRIICAGYYYEDQDKLAWVGDMDLVPHLWSVLQRPRINIYLTMAEVKFSGRETARELSALAYSKVKEACLLSKQRNLDCGVAPAEDGGWNSPLLSKEREIQPL